MHHGGPSLTWEVVYRAMRWCSKIHCGRVSCHQVRDLLEDLHKTRYYELGHLSGSARWDARHCKREEDIMKKKLAPLSLHRETLLCLASATLAGVKAFETGSNPHSACLTCTCVGCDNTTA